MKHFNSFITSFIVILLFLTSCSSDSLINSDPITTSKTYNENVQESGLMINNSSRLFAYMESGPNDGKFVRIYDNGNVFYMWVFGFKLRHVDSPMTWNGLFTKNKRFIATYYSFEEAKRDYQIGRPLFADNGLVQDVNTGVIFFREGNTLRRIMSPNGFNRYNFKWSAVVKISSLNGYEFDRMLYGSGDPVE